METQPKRAPMPADLMVEALREFVKHPHFVNLRANTQAIVRLRAQGVNQIEIARQLGISQQHVSTVLRSALAEAHKSRVTSSTTNHDDQAEGQKLFQETLARERRVKDAKSRLGVEQIVEQINASRFQYWLKHIALDNNPKDDSDACYRSKSLEEMAERRAARSEDPEEIASVDDVIGRMNQDVVNGEVQYETEFGVDFRSVELDTFHRLFWSTLSPKIDGLSDRQLDIAILWSYWMTCEAIAAKLGIDRETVSRELPQIRDLLNIQR